MLAMFSRRNGLILLGVLVVVESALLAYHAYTGELATSMLAAVDTIGPLPDGTSRDEMASGFVWISVAWLAATTTLAAFAFYNAASGKRFWLITFAGLGAWLLYEAASAPIMLERMFPGSTAWSDWFLAVFESFVWLFLSAVLAAQWRRRAD